jgi:hypothetical protein
MNKGLNYSEKLEAYIRNELTANEKLELEEQLRQDPLLQNELILQKDIISSICDYRKSELKRRLNKIDVGSSKNASGDFTVGGAILGGIAIVGVAGFLIFKDSGNILTSTQLSSSVSQMPYSAKDSTPAEEVTSETKKYPASVADYSADSNVPDMPEDSHSNSEPLARAGKKAKPAVAPAPVVVEANELIVKEEEIRKDDHLVLPENTVSSPANSSKSTLIIVDNNSSRYKLHYKYINDQLFLYGFEKPYKIIDLPSQTQRYLLYDGNFYKLNRNQPQVAPIQPVENQQEIKALKSYKTDNP